jgi:hypothetical protein
MNTSPALTEPAHCWTAYAKSVAFLLPALVAWWFSAVFLFPKLQQIWSDTGFSEPAFINLMRSANILLANGGWMLAAVVLAFGFLEWHGGAWLRYRRISLWIGAWLFNAAVLFLVTSMLLSAMITAPGLISQR